MDDDRIELDEDERHWLVHCCGTSVGGFDTEEEAQWFLNEVTSRGITKLDDIMCIWGKHTRQ
jgi:hypothetical protein